MEQQVAEAALALVHPTTDASQRSAASSFLEQWTRTPEAWLMYGNWLSSFAVQDDSSNTMGTRLLCLTLLLQKIRREVPRGTVVVEAAESTLLSIKNELWSLLQNNGLNHWLVVPLCSCTAALAVRCSGLQDVVMQISRTQQNNNNNNNIATSLKLLSCIPPEMEACADLTTSQVTNELSPYIPVVLDTLQRALRSDASAAIPALDALCKWTETCRISLSHLNSRTTTNGGGALLPLLIEALSQNHPHDESLLRLASNALTAAISVPSDSCTPSRKEALMLLLNSTRTGFISAPLAYATQQDDGDTAHALATTICTLVSEDVDDVCSQPAPPALLELLFYIQSHPNISVTFTVLDCWLAIQDVSTLERHDDWKRPLFQKVVNGLMSRVAYPSLTFTNWHDAEVDQDEFTQMRAWVADIFVSCYFLLRVGLIHQAVAFLGNDWTVNESALSCLCAVSREVCGRIKKSRAQTKQDRDATVQQLVHLVQGLHNRQAVIMKQPILLSTMVKFIGSYAPVWNTCCSAEFLLQLLALARSAMGNAEAVGAAAHATRALYVGCKDKLLECLDHNEGRACLSESMQVIVSAPHHDGDCVAEVAEGSTRLIVSIQNDDALVRQTLGQLVMPMMHRAQQASTAISTQSPTHAEAACESVLDSLLALTNVVKFCEVPINDAVSHPLTGVLPVLLPFLKNLVDTTPAGDHEEIVKQVLLLHLQLIRTVPALIRPHFGEIVTMVVGIFSKSMHYTALEYTGGAVEAFSPLDQESIVSFGQLLGHVTGVVCAHFQSGAQPDKNVELIAAFSEMNNRFILFCPSALINCQDFPMVVALSVECLSTCTAPACLNFLSHLFGWRGLRLSSDVVLALEASSQKLDEMYIAYGETITHACVRGLLGGSQLLWASMAECLIAIVSYNLPGEQGNRAQTWMYAAMSTAEPPGRNQSLSPDECEHIIKILYGLVGKGKKSKPKARMLLMDFAKICKGEMKSDALLTYLL